MVVRSAFRFELDPNNHQQGALARHAGAARFAYNWGLAELRQHFEVPRQEPVVGDVIGIDLGLRMFATCSDGTMISAPFRALLHRGS